MSAECFSVSVIAKQLDAATSTDFEMLLIMLKSPDYVNEKLLKSELALLNTKILALLRSSDDEKVWRGCHTAVVACAFNPLVLCSHSGQLLAAIYAKLEQKVDYYSSTMNTPHGQTIIETLVFAVASFLELMRDKPTLNRESLTPKLKAIIPTLINLSQHQPKLCLPVLKDLLYKNTTTFKPFASKFRQLLLQKLSEQYQNFDRDTQTLLCENYAYLHLIKINPSQPQEDVSAHHKSYLDENWRLGLFGIVSQFKPIIELCGEILDLDQDRDLKTLINGLECNIGNRQQGKATQENVLPGLKIDMNSPLTLWEIPKRLNLLIDLLSAFLNSSTPYPVRIPFGICINFCEALLSMTRNYLPLRRDLRRDSQLTAIIDKVIPQIQFSGIKLLSNVSEMYSNTCLSVMPSILASLELFIPLQSKSTNIDLKRCSLLQREFQVVFKLMNKLLPIMGHQFQGLDLLKKLTEIALYLSEDVKLINPLFTHNLSEKKDSQVGGRRKQKKDNSIGALSDLYTHPDKFNIATSLSWYNEVNIFLRCVLCSSNLPSNQQVKVLKYSISQSLKAKENFGFIPESFIELLRTEVLYPGNERVSILPIAVTLLKNSNDNLFDLLCHPRLPMSIVHSTNKVFKHEDPLDDNLMQIDQMTTVVENSEENTLPSPELSTIEKAEKQKQNIQTPNKPDSLSEEMTVSIKTPKIDESFIFKKRTQDQEKEQIEIIKRQKTEVVTSITEHDMLEGSGPKLVEKTQHSESESEDDDSEFEIPAIEVSDEEEE